MPAIRVWGMGILSQCRIVLLFQNMCTIQKKEPPLVDRDVAWMQFDYRLSQGRRGFYDTKKGDCKYYKRYLTSRGRLVLISPTRATAIPLIFHNQYQYHVDRNNSAHKKILRSDLI